MSCEIIRAMDGGPEVDKLIAFGRAIRDARVARRLSHDEAAALAKISKATWQNIERGGFRYNGTHSTPKAKNIVKAGGAMGYEEAEALAMAGYDPRVFSRMADPPSAMRKQALDLVNGMPEEKLPMTVGMLQGMANAKPAISPVETEGERGRTPDATGAETD